MWRALVSAALIFGAVGCGGGGGMAKEEAQRQLDQMLVLFQENRPKFVVQKQELEQERSCVRARALRQAADERIRSEAMSPTRNEALTMVQMELAQAEKTCLGK